MANQFGCNEVQASRQWNLAHSQRFASLGCLTNPFLVPVKACPYSLDTMYNLNWQFKHEDSGLCFMWSQHKDVWVPYSFPPVCAQKNSEIKISLGAKKTPWRIHEVPRGSKG
jgi:hypothetical protein